MLYILEVVPSVVTLLFGRLSQELTGSFDEPFAFSQRQVFIFKLATREAANGRPVDVGHFCIFRN